MRSRTILAAVLLVAALAGPAGADPSVVAGVVSAVGPSNVVIEGQPYTMTDRTQIKTPWGGRIAPHEIQPGTKVEAEVGETGEVVVLTADLLR